MHVHIQTYIYMLVHSNMAYNQSRAGVLPFGIEVSPEKAWPLDWWMYPLMASSFTGIIGMWWKLVVGSGDKKQGADYVLCKTAPSSVYIRHFEIASKSNIWRQPGCPAIRINR